MLQVWQKPERLYATFGKAIEKRARASRGVSAREKVGDHGHRRRPRGHHLRRAFDRDAADGDHGPIGGLDGVPNEMQSPRGITGVLAQRAVDRTDSDVIGARQDRRGNLGLIVRRDADDGARAGDAAGRFHGHVFLADVYAVGAGQPREIGAVVDNEAGAGPVRERDGGVRPFEPRAARRVLVAKLDEGRAPVEERRQDGQRIELPYAAEIDVDQRIETRDLQNQAVSASGVAALLFFSTR